MKKIIILSFLLCTLFIVNAQTKIGGAAGASDANAFLQIGDATGNTKGLLLPRVALTSTTSASPMASHVAGMFVYNTATAGDVKPGIYYNNGTKWLSAGGSGVVTNWALLGNASTTPGTNFIGTTDAKDFVIKTNNTERMRVTSAGNIGINNASPTVKFYINNNDATDGAHVQMQGSDVANATWRLATPYSSTVAFGGGSSDNIDFGHFAADNSTFTKKVRIATNGNMELENQIQIKGGSLGAGKFLTSDANGFGTWQTLPTGWNLYGNSRTATDNYFIGTTDAKDFVTKANNTESYRVTSAGQILVNTSATPTGGNNAKLIINNGTTNGAVQIKDGNEGVKRFLTSDVNGLGTWSDPTTITATNNGQAKILQAHFFTKTFGGVGSLANTLAFAGAGNYVQMLPVYCTFKSRDYGVYQSAALFVDFFNKRIYYVGGNFDGVESGNGTSSITLANTGSKFTLTITGNDIYTSSTLGLETQLTAIY